MAEFESSFQILQHDNKDIPKTYYFRLKHVVTGEEIEFSGISEQAMTDIYKTLPCYAWDKQELVEYRNFDLSK